MDQHVEMSHMATRSCAPGVLDCGWPATPFGAECAAYNMQYPTPLYSAALIGTGTPIAILMSICIGGNDAANAWGSTVGSGALSLRHAVLLGAFGEWLGATLLGQGVASTIRKGVSDIDDPACWACGKCDSRMSVYAVGMLAALLGAALFLLGATFGRLPVSTTHAIVGGVVGMTLVGTSGVGCLNMGMDGLGGIVASWVLSPALAGLLAALLVVATNRLAVRSRSPVKRTLLLLPWLYALTVLVMVALTLITSRPTKALGAAVHVLAPLGCAIVTFVAVRAIVVPRVRASLQVHHPNAASGSGPSAIATVAVLASSGKAAGGSVGNGAGGAWAVEDDESTDARCSRSSSTRGRWVTATELSSVHITTDEGEGGGGGAAASPPPSPPLDPQRPTPLAAQDATPSEGGGFGGGGGGGGGADASSRPPAELAAVFVFRYLLVFVAFLESFVHGANDTANATSAFSALVVAYTNGLYACSLMEAPWWIMSCAGLFVGVGVVTLGHRVIQTIGSDLVAMDYQVGFAVELASTLSVVLATVVGGLPVSTTHCKVGAVVCVGLVTRGRKGVRLALLCRIVLAWVLTLPIAGALAAILTVAFRAAISTPYL